jgi:hypothetical protein
MYFFKYRLHVAYYHCHNAGVFVMNSVERIVCDADPDVEAGRLADEFLSPELSLEPVFYKLLSHYTLINSCFSS